MKNLKPVTQRGVLLNLSALSFLLVSFGAVSAHGSADTKDSALRNAAGNSTDPAPAQAGAERGPTITLAQTARSGAAPGDDTVVVKSRNQKTKSMGSSKSSIGGGSTNTIGGTVARQKFNSPALPKNTAFPNAGSKTK